MAAAEGSLRRHLPSQAGLAAGAATAPRGGPEEPVRRPLRRRFFQFLSIAGPGLIAANAGNDAGGIATYSSAGSQYVYRTLFFMVLVTIGLVVVQEMSARLGAYTGKGLVSLIREEFSIRLTFLAVGSLLVANTGLVVSEFAGIGAALQLFGLPREATVPAAAVLIWSLVMLGSYRYAERVFLVLSLAFVTYPISVALGHPHWASVGTNTVLPHLLASKDFLLLGVALIGTTISPYMQLYNASGVVDRGIGREDYRLERLDTVVGAIAAELVSMCIIVATAAAIGGRGPLSSAKEAAEALRPAAGPAAEVLFALGLLGASALAGAVVPLSTSYAVAEAVGVERSVSRRFSEAPLFLGLFTAQVVVGAAVALAPINLITLLVGTQVIEGVVAPVVLVFILLLANRRSVLGDGVNGPVFRQVAGVAIVLVTAMSVALVVFTVLGWLGIG